MPEVDYSVPVSRLINVGDPRESLNHPDWQGGLNWLDYQAQFGLQPDHIPELIRMATDDELHQAASDSTEVWAPVHAWRALGQLKAAEAIEPLLGLFHFVDDEGDDAVGEDLPEVMGMIGPAAIQPVAAYLANSKNLLWAPGFGVRQPGENRQPAPAVTAGVY